jgi:hypothetical protein
MTNTLPDEAVLGSRIHDALNQSTDALSDKISVRLYEARCDALRHQAVPVHAVSIAGFGLVLSRTLQNHFRMILALLSLAVGAIGVQLWQNSQEAAELADIDSELLSDEVPPSAYTDQGFMEWLHRLSVPDEDSLPQ